MKEDEVKASHIAIGLLLSPCFAFGQFMPPKALNCLNLANRCSSMPAGPSQFENQEILKKCWETYDADCLRAPAKTKLDRKGDLK